MAVSLVVSQIFNVEKYRDLEITVRSIKVIESGTFSRHWIWFPISVLYIRSNFIPVFEIFNFKNAVTLITGLGVCQGH